MQFFGKEIEDISNSEICVNCVHSKIYCKSTKNGVVCKIYHIIAIYCEIYNAEHERKCTCDKIWYYPCGVLRIDKKMIVL